MKTTYKRPANYYSISAIETSAIKAVAKAKPGAKVDDLLAAARALNHRCALTGAIGTFTSTDAISSTDAIFRLDCLSFDRVIPGSEGAEYVTDNIQVVNVYINTAKRALTQEQFAKWIARIKQLGATRLKSNLKSGIRRAQARNRPS